MTIVVYILADPHGKTYVGATVDLERRLRQHNRSIKGGAKKTKRGGPWRVLGHVSGFENWKEALRVEWAIQHPHKSKITRDHVAGLSKRKKDLVEACVRAWPTPLVLVWES